ncbi:beta-L-arabinofuranosidase domain-containing protein [Streptomyces sp. KL116D]|uniref:beta-L-arabinofuranosidase domain-containing protein n=1 Tax=Streptomyces sp. KL116D TaxID=3045152 RepID=UPI00355668EA
MRLLEGRRPRPAPAHFGRTPRPALRRRTLRRLGGAGRQLRGHTTGHLLSGLAFAHANTGDDAYAAKARHLVAALAECQRAAPAAGFTAGYLSAFPEKVFADLEAGGKP